ncbi:hypothetical protein A2276_06930 [candidate division WOR-1 bacterium RIFOXYA12_FULL_43_27]|uniref:Uncharacterized protein n=1 Tax=candidate division WOR-1 bacterium RIFOXYC2_FULL_46_14 TaxID=1802587 RepID=A0A1F4U5H1_UNCSA|nr:MAG: hypothetical protein A2276_06930 [candidate division WOR-1 bacterium RIFOXYA12_FULL_43_27]OGC20379.1 MAG: hypothetical protein A2292_04930 [candidate division WOR-1 bacterium RIFOXYB2_FULL_46_45]OGC31884.1 MAG: hypothetical protein A2232_06520 [candidate division WOR-1 bacterium RIFOXYA2_FULL_46_56]OGC40225.1 MAG: hypothetical protein A2438_02950 [candidate division WOR-1 bacterium RIFOXYC2_FULL_46_14]
MIEKHALGIKIIEFTNMNPLFKGGAAVIVGILALLFALWVRRRFLEPDSVFYRIFLGISVFVILYGGYILVVRPQWWRLPY